MTQITEYNLKYVPKSQTVIFSLTKFCFNNQIKKLNELKINRVNKEKVFSYKSYVKTIHINTERIREWEKNY